jgi:hypothetical protein
LKFEEPLLEVDNLAIRPRLFPTSTFDLATLETRHKLNLPYQLMDVYLGDCKTELEIRGASDFEQAADRLQIIRMLFYLEGIAPFLVPFCTTYSVNDYSGINSRDSELCARRLRSVYIESCGMFARGGVRREMRLTSDFLWRMRAPSSVSGIGASHSAHS